MTTAYVVLFASLVVVALVHTRSRLAGAVAASLWCVGMCVFGVFAFRTRTELVPLGVSSPPWLYFVFFGGLLTFNAAVVVRALRRRAGAGPAPGTRRAPGGP